MEPQKSGLGAKAWAGTRWFGRKTAKLVRDSFSLARPLNKKEQNKFSRLKEYLKPEDEGRLLTLMRQGKAEIKLRKFDWSFLTSGKNIYPKTIFVPPEKRFLNLTRMLSLKRGSGLRSWTKESEKDSLKSDSGNLPSGHGVLCRSS